MAIGPAYPGGTGEAEPVEPTQIIADIMMGYHILSVPSQDIFIPFLDLVADKQYSLELIFAPNAAEVQQVSIYFNNDVAPTNYRRQRAGGVAATAGASAGNDSVLNVSAGNADAVYTFAVSAQINQLSGKYPEVLATYGANNSATNNYVGVTQIHRLNTENVTSLLLRHAQANGFAAGTIVRLFKKSGVDVLTPPN